MAIINALPSAESTKRTGTRRLSVVGVNAADGDEVQMDGDVLTDGNGNPIAWANIPGGGGSAEVTSGTDDDDLTINQDTGAATDVTVYAIVE